MKNILSNIRVKSFFLLIISPFFSLIGSMFGDCYQYSISKTEIKTRGLGQYNMPFVDAQISNAIKKKELQKIGIFLIATGAYSTNPCFGSEFAIDRKKWMQIAGDDTPYVASRDIRAEYVGGNSKTVAEMSLEAFQNLLGCRILVQIPFHYLFNSDFFNDWFLSIRSALVNLSQELNMKLEGNNKKDFRDIYNFFSFKTDNAKIDNVRKSTVGLENITLSLDGIYKSMHDNLNIYYYSGIEIPTSLTYSSKHLFYPIIGNNGNIGFLLGADFRGYIKNSDSVQIGFLLELENHFLLYKTVDRTFDLYDVRSIDSLSAKNIKNKPWSRYLPVASIYSQIDAQTVSAVSNLPVRIHECNVLDVSLGMLYNKICLNDTKYYFSLGYNLWMSQPEYAELQDRRYWEPYHLFYDCAIAGTELGKTASNDTINNQASDDVFQQSFAFNQLDLGSVAADGGYSQSIFLRATVQSVAGYSILFGGFYEIGKNRMIPSRVGGWIGGGIEF